MTHPTAAAMAECLIRQCEGCVLQPYADVAGNWTIGVGSIRMPDGSPVTASTPPITSEQADAMLMAELTDTMAEVDMLLTAPANDHQRAALYSFAYNEGCGALSKSTLLFQRWRHRRRIGAIPGLGLRGRQGGARADQSPCARTIRVRRQSHSLTPTTKDR